MDVWSHMGPVGGSGGSWAKTCRLEVKKLKYFTSKYSHIVSPKCPERERDQWRKKHLFPFAAVQWVSAGLKEEFPQHSWVWLYCKTEKYFGVLTALIWWVKNAIHAILGVFPTWESGDKTAGGILAGTMCRLRHPNPGTHFWVPATISPKSMFLCIKAYWMNRFCCIHGLGGFSPVQNLNINLYSFHVEYVYVIRYQIGVLAAGYMPCSQYCILYQKQ